MAAAVRLRDAAPPANSPVDGKLAQHARKNRGYGFAPETRTLNPHRIPLFCLPNRESCFSLASLILKELGEDSLFDSARSVKQERWPTGLQSQPFYS